MKLSKSTLFFSFLLIACFAFTATLKSEVIKIGGDTIGDFNPDEDTIIISGDDPPSLDDLSISIDGVPYNQYSGTVRLEKVDNGFKLIIEPPSQSGTQNTPRTSAQQASEPAAPTNNGTVASGNTRVPTPPVQRAAPRVANLRAVSGNAQVAKVNSRLPASVVQVNDQYGDPMPGVSVTFSASGDGSLSATSATTDANGQASTTLRLGSTPGTYTVTAKATDTTLSQTFTAEATPRILSRLEVRGESHRSVSVGRWIKPLKVRVLDTDNDPVSGEWVTFSVVSDSIGTAEPLTREALSNATGLAKGYFMPSTPGTILVEAKVADLPPVQFTLTASLPPSQLVKLSGDRQKADPGTRLKEAFVVEALDKNGDPVSGATVKFAITAGNGSLSPTSTKTDSNGRAQTTLTLGSQRGVNSVRASVSWVDPVVFNASIEPKVLVAAMNRPMMYWIAGGALYRQATGNATQIAASAKDVVVDTTGGKLYYIQQISERTGTVHRANLDGTNDEVLQTLTSAPQGLALDGVNKKLYLTNNWGKIQRMNVDGTQFETNFIVGLTGPMDIAVSSGRVYWTDTGGNVHFANLSGSRDIRTIVSGSGALGGIVADGRRVYWTEQTSVNRGRIRSVDLAGTVMDVFTLTAVPTGITVNSADNRLYWTNGWGKVQRERDRSKGRYEDVATDLMIPTVIAIGGANSETAEETPKSSTPTTDNRSKYDVNGDGPVDNMDVVLVTLAVGTNNAKYDVNEDGKVDDKDIALVRDNQDEAAAAAPMIIGMKLSADQATRIEEQIDLLIATGDRSPAAMRTLIYLQQLLTTARPDQTQLLANYPNPFNPETWIPYELATDTDVRITIYNAQGVVIRTLQLGQQSAGYYTDRERAAYWDGRNAYGEQVASGVYFYQLETDTMSALRKMVILK
jgi:5-hydroxyisourate hydrolase-like protein (transthyretin family)